MSNPTVNRRILLASRPHGEPAATDFQHDETTVPSPGPGQVLLRTLYLSLDPYVRGRMSAARSYAAPMEVGDVIVGGTVSEVVESATDDFSPGEKGRSCGAWQANIHQTAEDL